MAEKLKNYPAVAIRRRRGGMMWRGHVIVLTIGVIVAHSFSFLPNTDSKLLAWSANFNTLITATPTAYGLTAAQATAYTAMHNSFSTALAACDPGTRTKAAVVTKNAARTGLKTNAKLLSNAVNGVASVTNSQKVQLGLNVRSAPSPIPAPSSSPALDVISVSGWTVNIKLHDSASGSKRGKPAGVSGGSVFSYVGATPPSDIGAWKFEGNTGRTTVALQFASTVVAGATVWLTAFWFNGRKQSGPACAPVSTNLQGGTVQMAA